MNNAFHTVISHIFSFLTLCLLCFSLFLTPVHAKSDARDTGVTIDNGDLLYVIIPKEVTSEFSPTEKNYFKEKVEVDRHGYIFLPSQGNLKISGHTPEEISKILTNNLPKYLSKSDKASVILIEKRHYIQILGHVASPGWYNIPESANIQAILGQAGGVLEGADLTKVSISRMDNGKPQKVQADIHQYLLKGDPLILPPLHENDTVFVPLTLATDDIDANQTDAIKSTIRIFGAVQNPGIYPVLKEENINLLDLLIMANGETVDADLSNINIMRASGKKESFNIEVLTRTGESRSSTSFPIIQGGDIVHFPRLRSEAIKDPQTITISGPGSSSRGLRPFVEPMTPFEAISQAGGVSDFADTNDIVIIRRVDGKQQNLPYNYDKALEGAEPDVSFLLQAKDIIYIP